MKKEMRYFAGKKETEAREAAETVFAAAHFTPQWLNLPIPAVQGPAVPVFPDSILSDSVLSSRLDKTVDL